MGEYDFSTDHEPYPFAERAVARKIVHPKYNFFTYEYDLAVVRLESPVQYAPHIVPICLPGSDDLLIGENATVTGWGRLSEGGTLPSVLQEVRPSRFEREESPSACRFRAMTACPSSLRDRFETGCVVDGLAPTTSTAYVIVARFASL